MRDDSCPRRPFARRVSWRVPRGGCLVVRLFTALVALALLLVVAPAAPVPSHLKPKNPPLFFPTKVGAKWVYRTGDLEETFVVTVVAEAGGTKVVTVVEVAADGQRYA